MQSKKKTLFQQKKSIEYLLQYIHYILIIISIFKKYYQEYVEYVRKRAKTTLTVCLNQNINLTILTSRTSLGARLCTSKALRIGGNSSSNCTSTTAPMTATTFPLPLPAAALAAYPLSKHEKNNIRNSFGM